MKATLVKSKTKSQIVLEDGKAYNSKKKESEDDFYARVAEEVDEEFMDVLTIDNEVDEKSLREMNKEQLTTRLPEAGPLEKTMIKAIIGGVPIPEKVAKVAKKKATKPTDEEVAATQEAAKLNVGKACTFTPKNGGPVIEGAIRGLMTDKRVNLVYYRILDEDETLFHKRVDSDELTILDKEAPKTKKQIAREEAKAAKAKAKAEKEAAAKKAAAEKEAVEKKAAAEKEAAEKKAAAEKEAAEKKAAAEKEAAAKKSKAKKK